MNDEAHGNDFDYSLKGENECEEEAALFQESIPFIRGFSICVIKTSQKDGVDEDHDDDKVVKPGPAC